MGESESILTPREQFSQSWARGEGRIHVNSKGTILPELGGGGVRIHVNSKGTILPELGEGGVRIHINSKGTILPSGGSNHDSSDADVEPRVKLSLKVKVVSPTVT